MPFFIYEPGVGRWRVQRIEGESIDSMERRWFRAGGDVECSICGSKYYQHPYLENLRDSEGAPYLHFICTGDIVKL